MTTTSATLGERLDALIDGIDSLPSTHLFGAIALFSVAFAVLLLNTGGAPQIRDSALPPHRLEQRDHSASTRTSARTTAAARGGSEERREPKWHILKHLNYAASVSFLASVLYFASDASRFLDDSASLLKFFAGWSVYLCYFLGFFGISFVDADGLEREEREEEEAQAAHAGKKDVAPVPERDGAVSRALQGAGSSCTSSPVKPTGKLHPPAACAPVCSDPTPLSSIKKVAPTSSNLKELSDARLAELVLSGKVKDHQLEKLLDPHRAVQVRRLAFDAKLADLGRGGALENLPSFPSLDYERVFGANCEIVVGYIPLPCGMIGPLTLDGESVYIPMATTEGCLVASANRGCKAISQGSGAISSVVRDGITRAPCVRMRSAKEAAELKLWCETTENFLSLKKAFESTTSFGKLLGADPTVAGRNIYLRLRCFSGDAMGMNMVSKGSLAVIELLRDKFPSLELVALSGNMCTDKKAAATNWIEGRGKSVVVEATIPKEIVRTTLKTNVRSIIQTNLHKNLVGSAMAGALGGFNAHAANIVTAVFLATGQDPAQNVESSNCITLLEETDDGDLWISCTMPSIEVGTVGGGTGLPAQAACLKAIGCKGGGENPGDNSRRLASVVAAATMAGELSLLAALAANTLVQAHMTHNRKPTAAAVSK